jgi:hypothetical protein
MLASCGQQTTFAGSPQDEKLANPVGEEKTGDSNPSPVDGSGPGPEIATSTGQPGSDPEGISGEVIVEGAAKTFRLDISREFVSGSNADGRAEVNIVNGTISEDIMLKRDQIIAKNERNFLQVGKPPVAESFKQGAPPTAVTDNFEQSQAGILDILVVIDNSGSMKEEQVNLADKLSSLLSKINDSSWQVGVVTTDPKDTCLRALIKKGDVDMATAFKNAINAGVAGSGNEQGVLTSVLGIGSEDPIKTDATLKKCTPWIREKSSLAVLIVSDEDNCSNVAAYTTANPANSCKGKPWSSYTYLTDEISKIRTLKVDSRVYGLFAIPGTECKTKGSDGVEYDKLITAAGGVAGSICDADYSVALNKISMDFTKILKSQFALKLPPNAGSEKVYVNASLVTTGYTIVGTTLTFTTVPSLGAKIVVTYEAGGTPISKDFVVQETPAVGSVAAMENGVAIDPATFTVDYATRTVKFTTAPKANAEIRVNYRKEVPLPRSLEIGNRAIAGSLKATVNTAEAAIESYDPVSGMITLAQSPAELTNIRITFDSKEAGSPITKFPLKTMWNEVHDLVGYDKLTAENVMVTWANNVLSVDPAAFVEGRMITVKYRDESEGLGKKFELSNVPVDGKILITALAAGDVMIPCEKNLVTVTGSTVATTCDLSNAEKVILTYLYATGLKNEFSLSEVTEPEIAKWSVYVNGVLSINFTRTGSTITFPSLLPGGTIVKIVAKYKND